MDINQLIESLLEKEAEKRARPPYGAFEIYRETGIKLLQRGYYEQAHDYLSKAHEFEKEDIKCILKRGRAKSELTEFDNAINDAELVMDIDPNNLRALHQKAHALYGKREFEESLLLSHRGKKQRQLPTDFKIGQLQAEETIEDCIGRHAGPVLATFYPIILEMKERRQEPPSTTTAKDKKSDFLWKVMTSIYFGRMYEDMKFFDKLLNKKGIRSPNKEGSKKILDVIQDCCNFLEERRETLRTRRPYYVLKRLQETRNETLTRKERERKFAVITETRAAAKRFIHGLRELCKARNMKLFLNHAEKAIQYVGSKCVETELPNKDDYLKVIYNVISLTYMEQKSLFMPWFEESDFKCIVRLFFDIPVYKQEKVENAYKIFCHPSRNHRNIISKCEEELKITKDVHRRLFLLHEVAIAHSLLRNYEESKKFAEVCFDEAKFSRHFAWAFNSVMLLAKSAVRNRDKEEALLNLTCAKKLAHKLLRKDVMEFVLACQDQVKTLNMEIIEDVPKTWEEKISENMKNEDVLEQIQDLKRRRHILDEEQSTHETQQHGAQP